MKENNGVDMMETQNKRDVFKQLINPYAKKGQNFRKSQPIEHEYLFKGKRKAANYDNIAIIEEQLNKINKSKGKNNRKSKSRSKSKDKDKNKYKDIPAEENRESDFENKHKKLYKKNNKDLNINSNTEEKKKKKKKGKKKKKSNIYYSDNSENDKKGKHTDLVSLKSSKTKHRSKEKRKEKKVDLFNEVENQVTELKKKEIETDNIYIHEPNFFIQEEMGKPLNEQKFGINNGGHPYLEDTKQNVLADKGRLESGRKLVYIRFPAFETHEKIKSYNEKISALTIEKKKLQTYKKMVEKKFTEENYLFEKNFEKYEIAIANALKLGYSSLYLCNLCEKFILKNKRFFIKKLLQLKQEQQEEIISKWSKQKIMDDMKMKNMTIKMYALYFNNMKAIVFVLVNVIKKKISFFFHSLLYNTLKLGCLEDERFEHNQTPHKSSLEKSGKHNIIRNSLKQSLSLKQMIINIRKYELQIMAYAFAQLRNKCKQEKTHNGNKYYDNDVDGYSNSYFVSESENNSSYSVDEHNMNKIKEIKMKKEKTCQDKNEKKKSSQKQTEKKCKKINKEEEEDEVKKKMEQFQLSNKVLNKQQMQKFAYVNGDINFYSNDDNTSDSSVHIPHPNEVYNYLCYQEALNMQIKQQAGSPENISCDYYDLTNNVAYFENPYMATNEKTVFTKNEFKNKMQIKDLPEDCDSDLYYHYVKHKLSQYNELIRNSKGFTHCDIRNLPYASQSMSQLEEEEPQKQIGLQINKHDNKNANLLLANAKKYVKNDLIKESVVGKKTEKIFNTEANTHIVKKLQNRVSFMLNKKDKEAKNVREQSKNTKKKSNDEDENLEIHKCSGENFQKNVPFKLIKNELTDIISSLNTAPNDVNKHVKEINNELNKMKKKSFVCVVGNGPPNAINWNDKQVRNIMENSKLEKGNFRDMQMTNTPFNRTTSKILFILNKSDSKVL